MRSANTRRVIAIAPGTRHLGFAVLEGQELMRFGVGTFPGKKTRCTLLPQVEACLEKLIVAYRPRSLVVEEVFYAQAQLSPLLKAATETVKRCGRERGLNVLGYAPNVVKRHFCNGKPTRRALARAMASRYELLSRFLKENRTRRAQEYWQQMFDAVALGTFAVEERSEKTVFQRLETR